MAWLYVPGSAGLNSGSSSPLAPTTDVFVTSSGKGSLRQLSWHGWKTRPWIARLSGTISDPLMASRGADAWISSLPVTHANPSASPESAAEKTTPDTSGPKSQGSSESLILRSSFSKTSPAIYLLDSRKSFRTWSAWVIALRQVCSQRRKSAPRTSASDSMPWPTATVGDCASAARHTTTTGVMHPGTTLTDAIRLWPTPMSGHPTNANSKRGMDTLQVAAEMWPTPNAAISQDGEGADTWLARRERLKAKGYNGNGAGMPLAIAATMWPTPNVPNGGRTLSPEDIAAKGTTENGKRQVGLENVAKLMWPTPRSSPNENRTTRPTPSHLNGTHGRNLAGEATGGMWATPTTRDWKDGVDPSGVVPTNSLLGRQAPRSGIVGTSSSPSTPNSPPPLWQTPRVGTHGVPGENATHGGQPKGTRLNPLFVEWLMGLPIGWTDSVPLGTRSCPSQLPTPSASSPTPLESEAA